MTEKKRALTLGVNTHFGFMEANVITTSQHHTKWTILHYRVKV